MTVVPENSVVARRVAARKAAASAPESVPERSSPPREVPAWLIVIAGLLILSAVGRLAVAFPAVGCTLVVAATVYFGIKGATKKDEIPS